VTDGRERADGRTTFDLRKLYTTAIPIESLWMTLAQSRPIITGRLRKGNSITITITIIMHAIFLLATEADPPLRKSPLSATYSSDRARHPRRQATHPTQSRTCHHRDTDKCRSEFRHQRSCLPPQSPRRLTSFFYRPTRRPILDIYDSNLGPTVSLK